MLRPLKISLAALLLTAASGFAQIIIPGGGIGFPGGGMGLPFPGRNRRTQQQNQPTQNFVGTLRRISSTDLTLESDDHLITQVQLPNYTKYYLTTGNNGRNRDFQPGDQVSVDATQDMNNNYLLAVRVTQLRQGTADDRAAAEKPVDSSPISSGGSGSGGSGDDDPDRPRLRRAPGSDSDSQSASSASAGSSSSSSASSSSSGDDGPPKLRRASSPDDGAPAQVASNGSSPSSSAQSSAPSSSYPPAPRDSDDPGPPELRRGRPSDDSASLSSSATYGNSQPVQMADSRPSIHADDSGGVTRLPDAPRVDSAAADGTPGNYHAGGESTMRIPRSGDDIIDQARDAAFAFSATLPNYVVKQFTTRYATQAASGNHTSWRALDTVTADVVAENGAEKYKNILVDGRPPKGGIEQTGSWSSGEFSSLLQDVLSPLTNADFHGKHSTTIANRAAYRYDFSVEQPNSHWHVYAETQSYVPAYTGTIWIDKETFRALRVELAAQAMPRAFPLDTVESAVDYDFVLIGDSKYLLPVHSEALSCERGTSMCTRNIIDFRNYKKFTADSSITFSDNQ